MTRNEALALSMSDPRIDPAHCELGHPVCDGADMMRAAKQLGLWVNGTIVFPNDSAMEMLGDVAF